MNEPTLFAVDGVDGDDYAADRGSCKFPGLATSSAYSYGCRCIGCYKSQQARCRRQKLGPGLCAVPDCMNPKRRKQGAKYCDDHATSRMYERTRNYRPRPLTECALCGQMANIGREKRYPLCNTCTRPHASLVRQAAAHHVALADLLRWMADPVCQLCKRHLYTGKAKHGARGFAVDHDHSHCSGPTGCADCVRGLLCTGCNTGLGQLEALSTRCSWPALLAYIESKRGTPPPVVDAALVESLDPRPVRVS